MTFENTVSKILEEGNEVKHEDPPEGMKSFMTVDEAKAVCRDRSVPFPLTIPLRIKREVNLSY